MSFFVFILNDIFRFKQRTCTKYVLQKNLNVLNIFKFLNFNM